MKNRFFKLFFLLPFVLLLFSASSYAKKYANADYVKGARYAQITNQYGTATFMFSETYNHTLSFMLMKGYDVSAEFNWTNLQVMIASSIVIKGIDKESHQCKLTIEPNGKQFSIWIEVREKSGKLIEDVGIREIGDISFAYNYINYQSTKNVKTGFNLLKDWFTRFLL